MLAFALAEHEGELRADLQQYYNIDLDRAMDGEHSAVHVAALVEHLPLDSRLFCKQDKDRAWRLEHTLLAAIANSLNMLIYGMSDKKRRGAPPKLLGPSWMAKRAGERKLEAQVMSINKLREELMKPRR